MIRPDDLFDQIDLEGPRDPLPPPMAVPPCRVCLGTGVEMKRADPERAEPEDPPFTIGCRRCGAEPR